MARLGSLANLEFGNKIDRKYQLRYNVSVPYPKPGLAENPGNVELGAAPLVQHYSVFSARPGLGYGTLHYGVRKPF